MAMVSMKKDAEPEGNAASETCVSSDELYPYGLLLNLCDTDMAKLGITADALAVGQKMTITAEVEVVNLGMRKEQDGAESSAGLQIIALDLGLPANAVRAQSLYTKSSMNP